MQSKRVVQITVQNKFDEFNTNWYYTTNNMYCSIISDQPIYIAQIGVSLAYAGGNFVVPSLNTVPSIEQYEHSIQFSALLSGGTSYYSVVVPNDVYFNQSLLINSNLINPSWVPIYESKVLFMDMAIQHLLMVLIQYHILTQMVNCLFLSMAGVLMQGTVMLVVKSH